VTSQAPPVTFVGHPFAAIGKGEELRANIRALSALDEPLQALDIYRAAPRCDPSHLKLIEPIETRRPGDGVRIFHLNGDEIEPALAAFTALGGVFEAGVNVVAPAWELPVYPEVWAREIKRFDEVWAISRFVQASLAATGIASQYVGQSLDLPVRPFLSRRYFGIRESAFVFLTFMDFSSYSARKNPFAAIAMFRRLLADRPFDDLQIVLKMKGDAKAARALAADVDLPREACVVLDRELSEFEQHSLISACDCTASLHRSEGFGRGPGEAMRLGRLALATGWSGNLDFMDERNSLLVNYDLVPVAAEDYPQSDGQSWAEPDIEHAAHLARAAIDDPAQTSRRVSRGFHDVIRRMGDRPVGLRMLARLSALRGRLAAETGAE
jgi:hypothetical protein